MNKNLTRYKYRLLKILRVHQTFIVITVVLLILILTALRINMLNDMPQDQQYLKSQTSQLKSVHFNQDAINKIKSLSDSNVAVPGTELPSNRQNPFNE